MNAENPKHEAQIERLKRQIAYLDFQYSEAECSINEEWEIANQAQSNMDDAKSNISMLENDLERLSYEIESLEEELDRLRANE